jgi:acetyl-CoA carboxylase biotin carboxyl carrier protein
LLDIEKIRQLIEMMVANDLVEISLRDGDLQVNLKRPHEGHAAAGYAATSAAPAPTPIAVPIPAVPTVTTSGVDDDLVEINSPMVGTFYVAPDPESQPFVQVGSRVSPGTIVCMLEAMKTFSEIKAEIAGTIERILVKNMQAVEFGQPLFLVRPA